VYSALERTVHFTNSHFELNFTVLCVMTGVVCVSQSLGTRQIVMR